MKVIKITPRGFCPGVVNAIKIVNDVINNPIYPRPITVLGMIVHNRFVVDDLTRKGVITLEYREKTRLELVDEIVEGTVIITAHGVSTKVIEKLKSKNINVVDATCKDVVKTKNLIIEYLDKDYTIIYIGKHGHPEAEGIIGLSDNIHLIENIDDLHELPSMGNSIFVTNQTTFSTRDLDHLLFEIKEMYPHAIITDEICDSTRLRQEAIIEQNKNVDLCFIVGDKRSNNTNALAKISINETNTPTILIESVEDIIDSMLINVNTVSVSSGASTPTQITNAVISYLESK